MKPKTLFQIGTIAKRAGVNIQTLRYYERRNLLRPSRVSTSGYRLYSAEAVQTLHFIQHAKELGFKLEEIKQLLALRVSSVNRCESVRKRAKEKLIDVQKKRRLLLKMEKNLKKLIADCEKNKLSQSCPIIENLEAFS
ncbi:MAG: hypothetical protein COV43_07755 [Deltaproteobacteria bacterium CG11_big_fil_rev_8_21_14_0_20_42_23]|nr:MAG: hypothetical protein COV43_07755 [Deltaproteobacteria bacterium CG11_big_fil_rev_8_21_14_0_20_42_23]PJC63446.1 MAG: hypothetical protein CO021_09375 [Deltaproteobacteria bacterium CG_4_9_14_0_2_um_filter_42_21]